jgi:hypothetical protein
VGPNDEADANVINEASENRRNFMNNG